MPSIHVFGLISKHFACFCAILKVITANFQLELLRSGLIFPQKSINFVFQLMLVRFPQVEIGGWRDWFRLCNKVKPVGENVSHRQTLWYTLVFLCYTCYNALYSMRSKDYRLRQYGDNANMPRGCVNHGTIRHFTMHYFGIPKQTQKIPNMILTSLFWEFQSKSALWVCRHYALFYWR